MNLQQMVETVRGIYPQAGVTQLIGEINNAFDIFVEETFILDRSHDLLLTSLVTDKGEDITTDNGDILVAQLDAQYTFDLPTDCLRLYGVEFLRNDGTQLRYTFEYKVEHGKITFYDFYDRTQQLLGSESGFIIRLHYYNTPTTMVEFTDTSEVPVKFHLGILSEVMRMQAIARGDGRMAESHYVQFRRTVILGKRFANDRKTTADVQVKPEYF